ncbi:hypothetical protein [Baaleninema simplex]|uniref:hypothetical protein n=1 Tax=Baaleninema simplex TaxID=2862350 RepID=UPI000345F5C3|nr:hypothetical protein [Baaleninema simplex]
MNARWFCLVPTVALCLGVSPSSASVPPGSVVLAQDSSHWQVFASQEGRFQVMMPEPPRTSTESVSFPGEPIALHAFAAKDSQSEYLVTYSDYPNEFIARMGEPTQFLQAVKQGFLSGIEASEEFSSALQLEGYPALEVEYTTPEGAAGFARFYLVNSRLYQVIATSRENASGDFSENADRFFASFDLR